MERYASFKMAVKSSQTNWAGPAPGPRFASHNRNHVRPYEVRRPSTQDQQQIMPQEQQQRLQEFQRLQQQHQLNQQLQQIQQQWQQHQLMKKMQQEQQQQYQQQQYQQQQQQQQVPTMTLQSMIEKMISYQQPPNELLERERLLQQQNQFHQTLIQQQQQPIQSINQPQQQISQPPVLKPVEKIVADVQQQQQQQHG